MRIGTQKTHNKKMQEYLRANGLPLAVPKLIEDGSMRGCWRIYHRERGTDWNDALRFDPDKLTELGFVSHMGEKLEPSHMSRCVFVRFKGQLTPLNEVIQ